MAGNVFYCGTDVHSYTAHLNKRLRDSTLGYSQAPSTPEVLDILKKIRDHYANKLNAESQQALVKIEQDPQLYDPDLKIYVGNLFRDCWIILENSQENKEDQYNLFLEILQEINGTCVQGFSHRLLSFLFIY